MNQKSVGVRIAPYAVGIMCFVLPFVQLSCDGKKVMRLTGVEMVMGSEMKDPGSGKPEKIPAEPFAVVALLALAAGSGFSASAKRASSISAAIAGGVAVLSTLIVKIRADAEITKGALSFTVDYLSGFWLVCLAAMAGLVLSIMRVKENPKRQESP